MIKEEFDDNQELELADLPADDDDSILSPLQPRSSQYFNSNFNPAGQRWRLEDAARSVSMAREEIRRQAQEELERELELPPNWRERDRRKNLDRWHHKMALRAKAATVPRCEHTFADGTRCGSPRLQPGRLCHAHELMERVRPRKLNLLPMEDGNSIMLNIMEINRALLEEEITEQRARILLSSQQMGLRALNHVTFKFTAPERMLKERAERLIAEEDLQKRKEEFAAEQRRRSDHREEDQLATDDHRKTQTAECAESAEEEESAADEHRKAQIGESGQRIIETSDHGEENQLATDEHRKTQTAEPSADRGIGSSGDRKTKEEEGFTAGIAESPEGRECDSMPNLRAGIPDQHFSPPVMTTEGAIRRLPAV